VNQRSRYRFCRLAKATAIVVTFRHLCAAPLGVSESLLEICKRSSRSWRHPTRRKPGMEMNKESITNGVTNRVTIALLCALISSSTKNLSLAPIPERGLPLGPSRRTLC
jgi:hypothetical protein